MYLLSAAERRPGWAPILHCTVLLEAGTATAPEASRVPARWQELLGSEYD
ncbi:hypothetical protein [Pseudonocardia alaniniphila]|uniref:Uncharacterized protein n=1 Tax=Pseudonocardia alaniniphila TaxID=75291 RepID=A0ABS9TV01_9PSEU|nr:hypothetical protein [Pseudonocardia alaniniphila]MCH6172354.1 hypothetical protein [Pseudonocardia alaniniphila]